MITQLDPPSLPPGTSTYTHGTLVTGVTRTVLVSGQVPWRTPTARCRRRSSSSAA